MAQMVDGMHLDIPGLHIVRKLMCARCVEGKQTRAPFHKAKKLSSELLEVIHAHTCGPMPTLSERDNIYLTTVIDKHTRL